MKCIDLAILGAGIAGLGAALKARELKRDYMVFEAGKSAGGLLDNFEVNGFRFDNAVHLSFATEPKVRQIFDKCPYYTHPADSYNFDNGYWLKHPAQNNLSPLPADQKVELLESFLQRPEALASDDYESWLRHQYGNEIAERYPIRYTRKYWQCEASELSVSWIGNRMRRAEFGEILFGSYTADTPNTYYTKEMRYPVEGGYKAFIQPLIDGANVKYEHKVTAIDLARKVITFSNGESCRYNKLVSSLPLPILVELCGRDVPKAIFKSSKELCCTSIDLISVGFNKEIVKDLWFYIYDEDVFASRAYSPSVKSSDNAPQGCSSLQFEIYNPGRESLRDPDELIQNTVQALRKMGVARESDVLFSHHKFLKWGNVVFKSGMEKHRDQIRNYFDGNCVSTIGRFGEWDYLWSNQSFLSGYNFEF